MTAALLTNEIPDPTGWLTSIKLDGVRALWTGSALLTRNGNRIHAPAWFTAKMPQHRLDGELWIGNGSFDRLVSILQKKDGDWSEIEYHIFDLAESGTIEERIQRLDSISLPDHVKRVAHRVCSGMDDLDKYEREVVNAGGEGLVIRKPGSKYRPGRMGDVIKVKRLVVDIDRWQG